MASCPKELEPYDIAHKMKIQERDNLEYLWWGNYGISALTVAIDRCLHGRKASAEYIKEPLYKGLLEDVGLTEEEKYKKELQKAIYTENQWIEAGKRKGLPETII